MGLGRILISRVRCRLLQAQLLEVNLQQSTCIVSDGYHRIRATLAKHALDQFHEEYPEQSLTGTMVRIQKACFEIHQARTNGRSELTQSRHACCLPVIPHTRSHACSTEWPKFRADTLFPQPQSEFVLAVNDFMWIGGRPLDPIGEPVELDLVPEVANLKSILLIDDGDDDRIPSSQQVEGCGLRRRLLVCSSRVAFSRRLPSA
jgi:hypothetical protein